MPPRRNRRDGCIEYGSPISSRETVVALDSRAQEALRMNVSQWKLQAEDRNVAAWIMGRLTALSWRRYLRLSMPQG